MVIDMAREASIRHMMNIPSPKATNKTMHSKNHTNCLLAWTSPNETKSKGRTTNPSPRLYLHRQLLNRGNRGLDLMGRE